MTALDHRTSFEPARGPRAGGERRTRIPIALSTLLAAHGFAHFVGVVAAFDSLESGEPLEYLAGTWTIGNDLMVGLIGAVWAALGLGFLLGSIAVFSEFRSWARPLVALGAVSFAMCVLALWSAWIGLVVNAVVIVAAMVGHPQATETRPIWIPVLDR